MTFDDLLEVLCDSGKLFLLRDRIEILILLFRVRLVKKNRVSSPFQKASTSLRLALQQHFPLASTKNLIFYIVYGVQNKRQCGLGWLSGPH